MRILYICSDLGIPILGRKGAAVHVRCLTNALTRADHTVVVATPVLNKSPWDPPAEMEGSLLHLPPSDVTKEVALSLKTFNEALGGVANSLPGEIRRILYNQELETRLVRRFDSELPDFIYERASLYGTAGVAVARGLERPLIVELNAPLSIEQSTYRGTGIGELAREAERWTLTCANAVVVVSAALSDYVTSLGVPEKRVHVLPNGVDASQFRPGERDAAVRERWQLGDDPVLGFVGGLRPWHGIEVLPDLLGRLVPECPAIKLVVVGDGPLRCDLERTLKKKGLAGRAVLTGAVAHNEVPALVRHFDVAIAPYRTLEHEFYFSPLKLFEYMACGVPVVAPKLGQISEIVRDGETGLLFAADDLDAMATACNRLFADHRLRATLGANAAKLVLRHYTWKHNAERVVELATKHCSMNRSG